MLEPHAILDMVTNEIVCPNDPSSGILSNGLGKAWGPQLLLQICDSNHELKKHEKIAALHMGSFRK